MTVIPWRATQQQADANSLPVPMLPNRTGAVPISLMNIMYVILLTVQEVGAVLLE